MNSETLTHEQLARMIDHTLLRADASKADFEKLCQEAKDNHFASVAVNSCQVKLCKELLEDSDVHVGAAISFPLGQSSIETKVFETMRAIEDGADEIDYVINIGELKNGNIEYIHSEMQQIVGVCKMKETICKVILETCYLSDEEKRQVCYLAQFLRPEFVKTSTGFGPKGANVEDVKLMKRCIGPDVQVKAAGGIRSWDETKALIDAGASRIGTSASLAILAQFDEAHGK